MSQQTAVCGIDGAEVVSGFAMHHSLVLMQAQQMLDSAARQRSPPSRIGALAQPDRPVGGPIGVNGAGLRSLRLKGKSSTT